MEKKLKGAWKKVAVEQSQRKFSRLIESLNAQKALNELQEIIWETNAQLMNWYNEALSIYNEAPTDFYNTIYTDGKYYKDNVTFEGEIKPICPRKESEEIECGKSHVGECYRRRLNLIKGYNNKYAELKNIIRKCLNYINNNEKEIIEKTIARIATDIKSAEFKENPNTLGEIYSNAVSNITNFNPIIFANLLQENYKEMFLEKSKHYKNLIGFEKDVNKENKNHAQFLEINERKLTDKTNDCYNLLKTSEVNWQKYWKENSEKIATGFEPFPEKWNNVWEKIKKDIERSPPFTKIPQRKKRGFFPSGFETIKIKDILVLSKYYDIDLNLPIKNLVNVLESKIYSL